MSNRYTLFGIPLERFGHLDTAAIVFCRDTAQWHKEKARFAQYVNMTDAIVRWTSESERIDITLTKLDNRRLTVMFVDLSIVNKLSGDMRGVRAFFTKETIDLRLPVLEQFRHRVQWPI